MYSVVMPLCGPLVWYSPVQIVLQCGAVYRHLQMKRLMVQIPFLVIFFLPLHFVILSFYVIILDQNPVHVT